MLKVGVIGCGFMGELHCKTYSSVKNVDFAGVFDVDRKRSVEISDRYNVAAFSNHHDLIKNVDAVSIASPTVLHHKFAMECIKSGLHILIEKPIAATIKEADEIVKEAQKNKLTAAVGYIERFNPAVIELLKIVRGRKILSIEAVRLAPPLDRANDVSAVFDLMIHDIDIILAITNSSVKSVEAIGKKTNSEVLNDVAAGLMFDNGARASIKSNKVAGRKQRLLKIVCDDRTVEADLISKSVKICVQGHDAEAAQALGDEPIRAEILDFINAIEKKSKPCVSAEDSLKSFALAWEIENKCLTPHRF